MKSNNSSSIEVNPSEIDFKNSTNNKSLNENSKESKLCIKHCLLSRLIIRFLIFSYISSKINSNFQYIFANIPLFVIRNIEIYRLITNFFICDSFYELITGIFMISTIINNFENKEGTVLLFLKLVYNMIISQIILLTIYYIISLLYPIVFIFRINAREFLCISYLVKHLLTTETKKIYNPYLGELNDRFIIVLFLLIYFFLNHEYRFENIFCLYYGFIICKYKKIFDLDFFPYKYINFIETSNFVKILKISDYFMPFHNAKNNISNNTLNNSNINKYLNKIQIDTNDETIGLKAYYFSEEMNI